MAVQAGEAADDVLGPALVHLEELAVVDDMPDDLLDVVRLGRLIGDQRVELGRLAVARRGGTISLLGLPREKAVAIRDYTNDFIFKGLTLHAVIGRRIFETWIKMLDLLEAGLQVEHLVTNEFEGFEKFHEAMELLNRREAMKVVFYPNGKPQ